MDNGIIIMLLMAGAVVGGIIVYLFIGFKIRIMNERIKKWKDKWYESQVNQFNQIVEDQKSGTKKN